MPRKKQDPTPLELERLLGLKGYPALKQLTVEVKERIKRDGLTEKDRLLLDELRHLTVKAFKCLRIPV